jgi:hypothetical protein
MPPRIVLVEKLSRQLTSMERLDEMTSRRVTTFDRRGRPINIRITSPTLLASCRVVTKLLVKGQLRCASVLANCPGPVDGQAGQQQARRMHDERRRDTA